MMFACWNDCSSRKQEQAYNWKNNTCWQSFPLFEVKLLAKNVAYFSFSFLFFFQMLVLEKQLKKLKQEKQLNSTLLVSASTANAGSCTFISVHQGASIIEVTLFIHPASPLTDTSESEAQNLVVVGFFFFLLLLLNLCKEKLSSIIFPPQAQTAEVHLHLQASGGTNMHETRCGKNYFNAN